MRAGKSPPRWLAGSGGFDRESVDAGGKFVLKGRVYGAVTGDAAHSRKDLRHDPDPEMGFTGAVIDHITAIFPVMVAGMTGALVDDLKPDGIEGFGELRFDGGFDGHARFQEAAVWRCMTATYGIMRAMAMPDRLSILVSNAFRPII